MCLMPQLGAWKNKFESGVESIKNALKSSRPKFASRKEIVSKIKEIIEGDARFTVRDIARKVGISLSTVLYLQEHSYIINLFYRHALENGMIFLLIFEIQPLSQVLNNSLTITILRYQSITVHATDCYKYTIRG